MWHEGEAEKRSCEIATALQQYTDQAVKEEKNILHFFADICGGQNNRMAIIALYKMFIKDSIEELGLNLLVRSNSQNENDNTHSVLKQQIRNTQSILYHNGKLQSSLLSKKTQWKQIHLNTIMLSTSRFRKLFHSMSIYYMTKNTRMLLC